MAEERLQKIIARAGIASRRRAEELITTGCVSVNGRTVTELGSKADPDRDHIKVNGKLLRLERVPRVYLAFHKPDGCVTTLSDPEGRPTVMDYLRGVRERVYPVGRLDYHSEGLLLLTNDGELANALTAARSHVEKTYVVKVNGSLTAEEEEQFRRGVPLGGRRTAPAGLRRIKAGDNPWYEVKLIEGRNQQVRLMFKHFGKLVEKLRRVQIGTLKLDLKPGQFRPLTPREVARLKRLAGAADRAGHDDD
jgi:23S rRNA pseudouridine2605 synthase